jgi:hypothetical protein
MTRIRGSTGPVDLPSDVQSLENDLVQALPHPRLAAIPAAAASTSPRSRNRTPPADHATRYPYAARIRSHSAQLDHPAAYDPDTAYAALSQAATAEPPPKARHRPQTVMAPPTPPIVEHTYRKTSTPTNQPLFLKPVLRLRYVPGYRLSPRLLLIVPRSGLAVGCQGSLWLQSLDRENREIGRILDPHDKFDDLLFLGSTISHNLSMNFHRYSNWPVIDHSICRSWTHSLGGSRWLA